jgi:hypothetical protein
VQPRNLLSSCGFGRQQIKARSGATAAPARLRRFRAAPGHRPFGGEDRRPSASASFCRMDFEYFPTLSSAISAVHYWDRSFVALPRNAPTRESDGHERHRKIRRPSRQIEAAEDRNRGLRGVCRRRFGGMARRIRSARQGRENRSDARPKASIADLTDLLARETRGPVTPAASSASTDDRPPYPRPPYPR